MINQDLNDPERERLKDRVKELENTIGNYQVAVVCLVIFLGVLIALQCRNCQVPEERDAEETEMEEGQEKDTKEKRKKNKHKKLKIEEEEEEEEEEDRENDEED